jgi:hypothetical protein
MVSPAGGFTRAQCRRTVNGPTPVPTSACTPRRDTAWGVPAPCRLQSTASPWPLFTDDGAHLGFLSLLTGTPRTGKRPAAASLPACDPSSPRRGPASLLRRRGAADGRRLGSRGRDDTSGSPHARSRSSHLRISVLDFRDDTADHLGALVLVSPAGDASHLALSDLQMLGAAVEGRYDDRIEAPVGQSDALARAARLARYLGLRDAGELVRHAARGSRLARVCTTLQGCGDEARSSRASTTPDRFPLRARRRSAPRLRFW